MPNDDGMTNDKAPALGATKPSTSEVTHPPTKDQTRGFVSRLNRTDRYLKRHQLVTVRRIGEQFNPKRLPVYITVEILLTGGILYLFERLSTLLPPLGIILYTLSLPYMTIAIYIHYKGDIAKGLSQKVGVLMTFVLVLVEACVLVVSFSQLCRYLSLFFGGFAPHQIGYWPWLSFGITQLLGNVFFGVFSAYDITLSNIQPTAFWSQTLSFLFNLTLASLVIAAILDVFGKVWHNN